MRVIMLLLALAPASPGQTFTTIEMQVRSLFERGQWSEAAQLAAQSEMHSPDLDLYHGLALAKSDRLDLAQSILTQAHRRYPADPRFDVELAGIADRKHDFASAKKWLRVALWSDPGNEYGLDFLASLYLIDRNLPAALQYWRQIGKPLIQDVRFDPPRLAPLLRERIFAISGGQVLTPDRLRTTEANLDRLGLLDRYSFDLVPRDDARFDLDVHQIGGELSPGGIWGDILPLVRGLPYQSIYADFYNLRRQAINVHMIGRWDPDKHRIMADIVGPLRSNPRLKFHLALDARDERWNLRSTYFGAPEGQLDDLNLRKIESGGELTYGLTNRLNWTSGLWIAYRDFRNAGSDPIFVDGWSGELRNALAYRLVDLPEHRFQTDVAGTLRTARLFTAARSRFIIAGASMNATWLPREKGDDTVVLARENIGRAFGSLPFDEFFMLGMERDNDLWFRGLLGARDGQKGSAPLGTQYSLFQISLDQTVAKFPLGRIQIGPFLDSGRISDPSRQFGSKGWIFGTGAEAKIRIFGLSWMLVYGWNFQGGPGAFYTADRSSCRAAGLCL